MKNEKTIIPTGKNWNDFKRIFAETFDNNTQMSAGTNGSRIFKDFIHLIVKDFDDKIKYSELSNDEMVDIVFSYDFRYGVEYINEKGEHKIVYTHSKYPDIDSPEEILRILKELSKDRKNGDWQEFNDTMGGHELYGGKLKPELVKLIDGKRWYSGKYTGESDAQKNNILITNSIIPKVNEQSGEEEEGYAKGGIIKTLNKKVSFKEMFTK